MHLKKLELNGFKSFAHKSEFIFDVPIIAIVGPNGSGKSNVVESIRFVLGEQSVKSMRGKTGSDLIFKGSRDIKKMSRASATIVFDNTDRVFHLHQDNNRKISVDFDEVAITREVFTDGANKYLINGTEVRMKDVHELIASVNIGSSGHHIISQGEADRYLNANLKDRRVLIEEALGLKIYQYRIKESQRKLDRALDNMRESELLRRELAPHLKFLKRQVDKLEKAKHLQVEVHEKYRTYFSQEAYLINTIEKNLDQERIAVGSDYNEVSSFLETYGDPDQDRTYPQDELLESIASELDSLQSKSRNLEQEMGRIEGMVSVLTNQQEKKTEAKSTERKAIPFSLVVDFVNTIINKINTLTAGQSFESDIANIKNELTQFINEPQAIQEIAIDNSKEIEKLGNSLNEKKISLAEIHKVIQDFENKKETLLAEKSTAIEEHRASERHYYQYLARKKELDGKRALINSKDESLAVRVQSRNEELTEAKILLGVSDIEYQSIALEHDLDITRQTQEQLRREIERIKIRIEDIGGGSGIEVITEYEETQERDEFLEKEIVDIQTSINSLQVIIGELSETLNQQFDQGIKMINIQFDRFFKLMFGGGKAELENAVIKKRKKKNSDEQLELLPDEDDQDDEYGIDIKVQLPRKKVSDLDMLSGGERSLTSIALLFALSQVNPPPFLVLDETDAALDEANSQKYGDMIEQLSKYSQLVVVTHNRETMSRAQTLFGVTLGKGDASTMLSLRLEDATRYAK